MTCSRSSGRPLQLPSLASKRNVLVLVGLLVLVLAGQYAILSSLRRQSELAGVACHATNAGVPLSPEDVRVYIHPSGRPGEIVAEGDAFRFGYEKLA